MRNISIVDGEPFKAKVLQYSKSDFNKIVTSHLL